MKEATGEANRTVITIVLIAIVLAIGKIVITNVMDTVKKRSCCLSQGGEWRGTWSGATYSMYCSSGCVFRDGAYHCGPNLPTDCD